MKKLFTILMLIPILLLGQNEITKNIDLTKNSFYIETHLGIVSKLVLNYERQISFNEKVSWYGRIGGGYGASLADGFDGSYGFGGLCAITMITGKKNKHFEFNAGAFLGYEPTLQSAIVRRDITYEPFLLPILNIGYRYQKPGSGFVFRANVGFPSIGVSFGYAF
jgi:hypothetical protein